MKKILVLDDDTDILYIIDLILKDNDFIVKTTPLWTGITRTIETFAPDLMLIDIDLNGADGGDICKDLKKVKNNEKLPIILFSAYNMSQEYVAESNAQGFLNKPFAPSELINIISHTLDKQLQLL